ncbi:MAG: aminodeoxychorismate synthase component I [Herpetosiphonaceae bacterium]|nr:aminodeoxychorismate synthase component I [Herpetosiphonaceae bacterium]
MQQPTLTACPVPALDTATLAAPYTVLLDSAPGHPLGGRALLAQQPFQVVIVRGRQVTIHCHDRIREEWGDPWAILADLMQPYRQAADGRHPCPGGVIGYLGYDLGRLQVPLPEQPDPLGMPDAVLGFYRDVICWQPGAATAWHGRAAHAPAPTIAPPLNLPPADRSAPAASLDRGAYMAGVQQVLDYIAAGDIYQANLTIQMRRTTALAPAELYARLRQRTSAPFSAYLNLPDVAILSASPERFLHCSPTGAVESRPIKGTRPRGATPEEDAALAAELYASEKERAENLMITDLLRNDLGQVCAIGSVQVPALWQVETFPTVHHLVSTVTGQLGAGKTAWDLLRACWPGGSITGAPKRRAMEIIAALEPISRGVYCGAIGYWSFDGGMDTSIVIRTLVQRGEVVAWGVGCGIVADSDPAAEYAEALLKAAALEAALGE